MNMHRVLQAVLVLAAALQQSASAITAPVVGQTLQAQVTIHGTIDSVNFAFAELAFTYAFDSTDTWFQIQHISQPVQDGVLAVWDTTGLSEGDYRLRLRVYAPDGTFQDAFVNDLHLRNEPPPTATPGVTSTAETPGATPVSEPAATNSSLTMEATPPLILFTPPPLPPNPASITAETVYSVLARGALLALLLFLVLGLFFRLRRP